MPVQKRVYNKKVEWDEEWLIQMKEENRKKLDEIMKDPEYMLKLGKKYYGERWYVVMPDGHYLKQEHQKAVINGTKKVVHYMDKPIIQYDMDWVEVEEWESARAWSNAQTDLVNPYSAAQHVSKCATGKGDSAYGYRWKFKDDVEESL